MKELSGKKGLFRIWLRSMADVMARRECLCCGNELRAFETDICTFCLADLPDSYTWISGDSPADKVFWGRVATEKVTSLFLYKGPYRNLVYSLKYKGNYRLAVRLGRLLGQKIAEDIDLIVPVPLHPRKKRHRGYNQSELISKGILLELKKRNPSVAIERKLLQRRNFTRTQTQKDRADRWKNVCDAFRVSPKRAEEVKNKFGRPHILIVDDVLTTGATLDACATNLLAALDCRISIATLAYVP